MRKLWRFFTGTPTAKPAPSTLRSALRDTMGRAGSWDGRRLRRRLLSDFEYFEAEGASVSSLNPMGGYLRIMRAGEVRQSVILRYVEKYEAARLCVAPGWVAIWDNLDAECWALEEERRPAGIADMIADFVGAA